MAKPRVLFIQDIFNVTFRFMIKLCRKYKCKCILIMKITKSFRFTFEYLHCTQPFMAVWHLKGLSLNSKSMTQTGITIAKLVSRFGLSDSKKTWARRCVAAAVLHTQHGRAAVLLHRDQTAGYLLWFSTCYQQDLHTLQATWPSRLVDGSLAYKILKTQCKTIGISI